MPRANTQKHFTEQSKWDANLLTQAPALQAVTTIRELAAKTGTIPAEQLAQIISVPLDYVKRLQDSGPSPSASPTKTDLSLTAALTLVSHNIPKILGWKSLVILGKELGIHRNAVESMVKLNGKPDMLRLCRDNCLYISPEGEKLVREVKKAKDLLVQQELVVDFAKRANVPLNHVSAFFSARQIPFDCDIHGRARISDAQKEMFLKHLKILGLRRAYADQIIEGKLLRSVHKLAEDRASIFAPPGTELHRRFVTRSENSIRHFAKLSRVAHQTELGVYVPAESADTLINAVTRADAARLLGVSGDILHKWRRLHRDLVPSQGNGLRQRGLDLEVLAEVAHQQFSHDPTLSQREHVPTLVASLMIHHFARRAGTSFSRVVSALPISPQDKDLLEERSGQLPRSPYNLVAAILRPDVSRSFFVSLERESVEKLTLNATRLGVSPAEMLELTLSPEAASKIASSTFPIKVGTKRFHALLAYGLADARHFDSIKATAGSDVLELLKRWSLANKVHMKTALSIINPSLTKGDALERGNGNITGASVKKVLSLIRMTADEARRAHPGVFAVAPKFEEAFSRSAAITQWGKNMVDAPLVRSLEELPELLEEASHGDRALKLKEGRLASELVLSLIHNVATARRVSPQIVYQLCRDILGPVSPWPTTYADFLTRTKSGTNPICFATVVGKFLVEIANPNLRVYQLGVSKSPPKVGELFLNSSMHDYGIVKQVVHDEGGRVARVELVLRNGSLSVSVTPLICW